MSTTGSVKWNDYDESRISISCNGDEIIGIRTNHNENVSTKASVAIDRLPEFVTALYAAAGKPEPVILDRLTREQCHQQSVDGIRTYLAEERLVGLDGSNDDMSPATALILAARLASLAGLAENEPDPAEVDDLTEAIAEALKGPVIDASADLNTSRIAARTALRWMRGREAQS